TKPAPGSARGNCLYAVVARAGRHPGDGNYHQRAADAYRLPDALAGDKAFWPGPAAAWFRRHSLGRRDDLRGLVVECVGRLQTEDRHDHDGHHWNWFGCY